MSSGSQQPTAVGTRQPPEETRQLVLGLRNFLGQPLENFEAEPPRNVSGKSISVGAVKWGVYAFFDFDDEPIYVGQTRESLGQRISRHLTNQRTDAVAMAVLDPFEVLTIKVWPLPQYQQSSSKDSMAVEHLNALERSIFMRLISESRFGKILNEKDPAPTADCLIPDSISGTIVPEAIRRDREHPDIRIARRAMTIARLAQIVSGRQVGVGLRRTLQTQADRLAWLAAARFNALGGESAVETEGHDEDT